MARPCQQDIQSVKLLQKLQNEQGEEFYTLAVSPLSNSQRFTEVDCRKTPMSSECSSVGIYTERKQRYQVLDNKSSVSSYTTQTKNNSKLKANYENLQICKSEYFGNLKKSDCHSQNLNLMKKANCSISKQMKKIESKRIVHNSPKRLSFCVDKSNLLTEQKSYYTHRRNHQSQSFASKPGSESQKKRRTKCAKVQSSFKSTFKNSKSVEIQNKCLNNNAINSKIASQQNPMNIVHTLSRIDKNFEFKVSKSIEQNLLEIANNTQDCTNEEIKLQTEKKKRSKANQNTVYTQQKELTPKLKVTNCIPTFQVEMLSKPLPIFSLSEESLTECNTTPNKEVKASFVSQKSASIKNQHLRRSACQTYHGDKNSSKTISKLEMLNAQSVLNFQGCEHLDSAADFIQNAKDNSQSCKTTNYNSCRDCFPAPSECSVSYSDTSEKL